MANFCRWSGTFLEKGEIRFWNSVKLNDGRRRKSISHEFSAVVVLGSEYVSTEVFSHRGPSQYLYSTPPCVQSSVHWVTLIRVSHAHAGTHQKENWEIALSLCVTVTYDIFHMQHKRRRWNFLSKSGGRNNSSGGSHSVLVQLTFLRFSLKWIALPYERRDSAGVAWTPASAVCSGKCGIYRPVHENLLVSFLLLFWIALKEEHSEKLLKWTTVSSRLLLAT